MTSKIKAYIRVDGRMIRVFPRSRKVCTYRTMEQAVLRLEALHIAGQGIVAPADWDHVDYSRVLTIAL